MIGDENLQHDQIRRFSSTQGLDAFQSLRSIGFVQKMFGHENLSTWTGCKMAFTHRIGEFFYWYPTLSGELMQQVLRKFGLEFHLDAFSQQMECFIVIARFTDWVIFKDDAWFPLLSHRMTVYLLNKLKSDGIALFPGQWAWEESEMEHSIVYRMDRQSDGKYRLTVYNCGYGLRSLPHKITEKSVIRGNPKWVVKNIYARRLPALLLKISRFFQHSCLVV